MSILGNLKFKAVIAVFMIMVIAGCETAGIFSSDKFGLSTTTHGTDNKIYTAQKGLTPKQRFSKALSYLEHGQVGQASAELGAYLNKIPNSKRAKDLLQQINVNLSSYFPSDKFSVELKSGESLSTLSRKYLGSALKFFALAKYNNISNPSKVNIGQIINIPKTKMAIAVNAKDNSILEETVADSSELMEVASKPIIETPSTQQPVTKKPTPNVPVQKASIPKATPSSVMQEIINLNEKKEYNAAIIKVAELENHGILTQNGLDIALTAYAGNGKQLASTDKINAARSYAKAGELNMTKGKTIAAFMNYKTASELDPDNAGIMEEMLILQKDITDKYHRKASSSYRNQELDKAIATWDKVLEIDPDHDGAKLYRAQAIELKDRLAKIKN